MSKEKKEKKKNLFNFCKFYVEKTGLHQKNVDKLVSTPTVDYGSGFAMDFS